MKILCIGNANYEITLMSDNFPLENSKNKISSVIEGISTNAAYLLSKWGMNVSFLGTVGNDIYGKKIKEELDNVGVDTKYLTMQEDYQTNLSLIIFNKENSSRTILSYDPNKSNLADVEIEFEPGVILVDSNECNLSKKFIKKYPKAISIIATEKCNEEIKELSHYATYLICSHEFAEYVTGLKIDYNNPQSLVNVYNKMIKEYNNHIIITLKNNGCLYSKDGKINLMPSIKTDCISTKDIFYGAFTYGIANSFDLEEILKISNIAETLSTKKIGTIIPSKEEIKGVYNEFR